MTRAQPHALEGYFRGDGATFVSIPNWLASSKTYSWTEKAIYGAIASYVLNNDSAYPRQETVGAQLGVSRETVSRAVKRFAKDGLLKRVGRAGTSNEYELNFHPMMKGVTNDHNGCDEMSQVGVINDHRGCDEPSQGVCGLVTQLDREQDKELATDDKRELLHTEAEQVKIQGEWTGNLRREQITRSLETVFRRKKDYEDLELNMNQYPSIVRGQGKGELLRYRLSKIVEDFGISGERSLEIVEQVVKTDTMRDELLSLLENEATAVPS